MPPLERLVLVQEALKMFRFVLSLLVSMSAVAALADQCPKDVTDTQRAMIEGPEIVLTSLSRLRHSDI